MNEDLLPWEIFIDNPSADVPDGKGKKGKRSAKSDPATRDFGVEYAASGRATCRGCEIKILKDEVRIKKVVFDTEVGMKYGGQPLWHHVECFAKVDLLQFDIQWYCPNCRFKYYYYSYVMNLVGIWLVISCQGLEV